MCVGTRVRVRRGGREGFFPEACFQFNVIQDYVITGVIIISSWPTRFCRVPFASVSLLFALATLTRVAIPDSGYERGSRESCDMNVCIMLLAQ